MTIITTGIKTDRIVPRREIRDLLKDKDVANLYLLAIDQMQKVDQKDFTSWFQLAGIHGRPYVAYDNVGQKGTFGGYCTHSSILFPTWHRPYLALFEQTMAAHVCDIASKYPNPADKERYTAAAERFRIPYWDWASEPKLPDMIATQETVTVHAPDGTRTMKNPLYSYKFNPVYSNFGDGLPDEKTWEAWQTTFRYPTTTDAKAVSQPTLMEAQLDNNRLTLRDRTYNLLTQATDYVAFSNDGFTGPEQDPAYYDSLESIHGQIHGLVGANGHMGVIDYAAFDPTFWMHHANVDRIFALWQGLNPKAFVVPKASANGTFTTPPGTIENSKSPLTPFRLSTDKYWDSDGVRTTHTFKYTYPELVDWDSLPEKERGARLRMDINRLYGKTAPVSHAAPSVFKGLSTVPPTKPAAAAPVAPPKAPAAAAPVAPPKAPAQAPIAPPKEVSEADTFDFAPEKLPATHWHETSSAADDKTHYHEWIANIVVEKYAVNTSFFVHIFLGEFGTDSKKWGLEPNLVGTHVVFANNANYTGCERCRDAHEKHKLVTGTIPLTGALHSRLGLQVVGNLDPSQAIPYLQQHLHWRIQRHDGTAIERTEVPSLKISVGHAIAEVPSSPSEFGTWGDIQIHHAVTSGRIGGAVAPA